ncbi:MAG TPA: hemolysin family protein [Hyphomicrobiales bacterium]|nr:hemolysin family protein [Hyphomicrobiales bacterium]
MADDPPPSRDLADSGQPSVWRRLFGWLRPAKPSIREDLEDALRADAAPARDFSPEERAMLKNILGLRELTVEDVMVPRADITAVEITTPLAEVLRLFRTAEHSRLPVYRDTLDDPRGMVHIKDLVGYVTERAAAGDSGPRRRRVAAGLDLARVGFTQPLGRIGVIRPVLYVPPSMPAMDLLAKMQATRLHLALVIDEYGGTDGLATIEDLLEMVVGDIEDEHDEEEGPALVPAENGAFIADARVSLEDAVPAIGTELLPRAEEEEVDTLGGLLVLLAGRVPVRGEIVAGPGNLEFEVLDADPRRVKRVKIRRRPPGVPVPPAAGRRRRRDGEGVAPDAAAPDDDRADSAAPDAAARPSPPDGGPSVP